MSMRETIVSVWSDGYCNVAGRRRDGRVIHHTYALDGRAWQRLRRVLDRHSRLLDAGEIIVDGDAKAAIRTRTYVVPR